jgi:uncharacterized protein DUF481
MRPVRPAAAATAAAFACLTLAPRPGRAQINVEPLRSRVATKPIAALIEANLSGSAGNVEGLVAGGGALVASASGPHFGFAYGKGDFARFNGTTTISRSFAHARYNYQLASALWLEAFGQVQNDLFQRLRVRNLVGAGPRYALYQGDTTRAFVGLAYMFEFEVINPPEGSNDPARSAANRLSSYVSFNYAYLKSVNAGLVAYVQPRVDRPSDARALVESGATFTITPTLASKVAFTLRYDSDPPTGVRPHDVEVKNSFTLTF